jgi:hypothetical protein
VPVSHQPSPHHNGVHHNLSPNDTPRAATDGNHAVVEERMRQGLVVSVLPEGPHGIIADLKFYLNNNHMLLWAIFAHPAHPYPPQRRRLVLLNSLAFCFFVSSLLFLAVGRTTHIDVEDKWRWQTLEQGAVGLRHLTLLREWPTTLSVLLQLLWDVPGASLGICPCARAGMPPALRKPCGFGMLACLACHLLGILYGVIGVILLGLLGPGWSTPAALEFGALFARTKLLAFLLALPASSFIFLCLRCHEQCAAPQAAPAATLRGAPGHKHEMAGRPSERHFSVDLSREGSFVVGSESSEGGGGAGGADRRYRCSIVGDLSEASRPYPIRGGTELL